ncbi:hypothetical protein P9990_19930 [Prescottella equi]|uniref:hypothetical protein n=1 Tax=Rhodococcus hoagii TaxID=43767 RepID=UPI002575127C|nr:hypothetical protein [Prescottella equi]WJJ10825.1 hypothetical protein P9990_19930 [Prescottella equi]
MGSDRPGSRGRRLGKLIGLLQLIATKTDLVEVDLDLFYHRDIRDLWRRDDHGLPLLTLRQLWVRLRLGLPRESALAKDANGGRTPWSIEEHLIADLWAQRANAGKARGAKFVDHPSRPAAAKKSTQLSDERIARGQARFAERQRKLNGGN